jgi:hypothetical protein
MHVSSVDAMVSCYPSPVGDRDRRQVVAGGAGRHDHAAQLLLVLPGEVDAHLAPQGGREVEPDRGRRQASTGVQRLASPALVSIAASTRWTCNPAANDGCGSVPVASASRKSRNSWVNVCS